MKNIFSKNKLFTTLFATLAIALLFFGKNILVDAAINPLLDFQGKIINSDGTSVSNAVYDFKFEIYDAPTGGNLLWSEELNASSTFSAVIDGVASSANGTTYSYNLFQATSTLRVGQYLTNAANSESAIIIDFDTNLNEITVASGSPVWTIGDSINNRPRVDGGVAMLNLGTVSDLSILNFNSPMYLETTFDGELMQPRRQFTSVSQSFNAMNLDGRAADEYASLSDNEIVTGQWSFTDILDISASSTSAALTISQNGSGNLIDIKRGGTTAFSILNDGRVAIGAYILPANDGFPGYVLKSDGAGNVSWQVDLAGFGGSGLWATSTDGRIIRPVDTSQVVVIGNIATSSSGYIFEVDGSSLFDDLAISDENEIRFYDSGNNNYFAFKASSTMGTSRVFTLPTNSYNNEDSLMVDGNGNMFWGKRAGMWESDGPNAYYTQGNIYIGTSTGSNLLTVGAIAGSQFLVNTDGHVVGGEWRASIVDVTFGGTGRSSWSQYAIPYMTSSNTFGEITIGTGNYLLAVNPGGTGYSWIDPGTVGLNQQQVESVAGNLVATGTHSLISIAYNGASSSMDFIVEADLSLFDNSVSQFFSTTTDILGIAHGGTGITSVQQNSILYASAPNVIGEVLQGMNGSILQTVSGVPTWVSTSSLGIDFNAIGGTLDPTQGGTGQDSSAWTGLPFVTGGVWSQLSVLPIINGGTGTTTFDDLITLGTHTTGNYLANATGTGSIIVTGALGEGVTRIIDVADNSITPTELAVSGNGSATNILTSDGLGGFTWVAQGSVGTDTVLSQEQVEDFAANLISTTTGTYTLITVTYNDNAGGPGSMNFVVDGNLSNYTNDANFITREGISSIATGLAYASTTGIFSLAPGYEIPTTINTGIWTSTANLVSASSSSWTEAFNWGDHSTKGYFVIGTDVLSIADGGTGTSSASGARENLGLGALATLDNINNNYWDGQQLSVANGGTGKTSWTAGAIPYLLDANNFGEIVMGGASQILQINSLGNGYTWVDSGSVGVDTKRSDDEILDLAGGLLATSSPYGLLSISYDNALNIIDFQLDSDLSLYDNSISQFFSTTTDILDIIFGGTGAVTAAGARNNLGLADMYNYGVNSEGDEGEVWQSTGNGRGQWVSTSSLGIDISQGYSTLIGKTTYTTNASFSTSTFIGYQAANEICRAEFPNSHFCRTYDILVSIERDDISSWSGDAWIAEGPPGYTSNSNDCSGWTSDSNGRLGAFWAFDSSGGGMGWLTNCAVVKPLACCAIQ